MKFSKEDRRLFYALLFPALIEGLFSRIFHITDSIMIGQMADSTPAVAAVGLCGAPIHLIISLTSAFFVGTTATISWHYGAGDKETVKKVASQSMTIAFIMATVLTLFSVCFAGPIMKFICGENEVLPLAVSYYRITAYGFFFQILTLNITAMFRGIGISKLPMIYNILSGLLNVVFNYALIYGRFGFPELRSAGAAIATTLSKIVAFVFAFLVLILKNSDVRYRPKKPEKFCYAIRKRFTPIAFTAAGEQLLLQVGAILTAKIIAGLPTADVAANQIVNNIESFAWTTGGACQAASTSLFGRFLGSENTKNAKASLSFAVLWAMIFSAAEMVLFTFFGHPLTTLFSNDTSIYGTVYILLYVSTAILPFVNVHQTVSGALRSAGDSVAPLIASFISLWVFRVALGYLIISVLNQGIVAYKICILADQFVRCLIVSIFYLTGHWKKFLYKKR